ncbi:uncharacterized protein [Fopius arisanus]|uniref:Uncharacterized protein isoform X1 n=1 Tax=Fopius arisanus TaxID=64838 RepID=A0A9R1TSI2_9HYME|nr:PREDICTED: uncharacterized protein LOC105273337 isoform X1 [Fopius arisanus]
MAYVLWRVLTKKYAKVRLGLASLPVIPAERRVPGEKEETWTLASDVPFSDAGKSDDNLEFKNFDETRDDEEFVDASDLSRCQDNRKSRAKKVKSYLKKCKGALSSAREDSSSRGQSRKQAARCRQKRHSTSSSWYLDDSTPLRIDGNQSEVIVQIKENLPTRTTSLTRDTEETVTRTSPRRFGSESLLDSDRVTDETSVEDGVCHPGEIDGQDIVRDRECHQGDPKNEENQENRVIEFDQENPERITPLACRIVGGNRGDVASLVRNLLGPIYGEKVLDPLTRQARDILVCAYHGNLESFVDSYLSPASILLSEVKSAVTEIDDESLPKGWPLTLSGIGLILHLGELESSSLRHGECYLCVRNSVPSDSTKSEWSITDTVEIALVWRTSMRTRGILDWENEFINKEKVDGGGKRNEDTLGSTLEPPHVFSPIAIVQEVVTDEEYKLTCPKLPTMRLEQRQTGRRKEEARMKIEDLKRPNYLESVINATRSSDLTDDDSSDELANLIGTLLLTVERKIERVSIDDIIFPCPACRNIDTDDPLLGCKCSGLEDTTGHTDDCGCGNATEKSKTFEVAGIKHIDSDDEEEVRMGFGAKRLEEVPSPRSIHDLPERVLHCGLRLPGYADDASGRLVLEFENETTGREKICPREIASYLLYLARLHSSDRTKNGWTLVIRGGNEEDLETLDRALVLVQGRVHVRLALLLRNNQDQDQSVDSQFPRSHVKISSVDDATINRRFPRRRDQPFDQDQWIAFYKEYDSVMSDWQASGRRLVLEMSELKDSSNVGTSLTPLSRLLSESSSLRSTREMSEALSLLEDRAAPVSHLEYTVGAVKRARRLMDEVSNAATRLESSFESRRATMRNLAVLRTIEEQAREVLSWLCKKGEDVLAKHARHTATTLTAARLHERDFEKFYFASMRHLDKGSDLAEAAGTSGLDELARSLREHLRDFGSRLDERRETLEDTSRCCLLQDRAQEWAHEARNSVERANQKFYAQPPAPLPAEHFAEMVSLAEKLGNDTLVEQCRNVISKCQEIGELMRLHSTPDSPSGRRRSFATSESAAESNSWDDTDSNAGSCPTESPVGVSGGSRPTLDNIAELGESGDQQLLETPPRSPPRSPAASRRLGKPPVNSHLQRSPSIAPAGMKAKKTILLIMREMIQTERDYVKSLEYIIENYIPELVREDIPQAMRGQRNVIFGNVEKIYEFHSQHFLRELEQCEHSPMMVGQCFLRHENKFYLYALYNKNKPNSDSLMAEYGTNFFKAKQLELGDKMDLASYLLKPVQRMGKYALLLQQLVKAGTDLSEQMAGKGDNGSAEESNGVRPIVEGEAELRAAEQMVRFQLRHGNDLLAMDSLRDCDVNVKEQGRLLRQNEFLVWQGKGKKCLRQVFLFEDLILFSKARRFPDRKNLDIYIYKHSIKTTDIGLTAVMADSPTKFEIWFRKRKPGDTYTLQCASEDIKKAWTEELSNLLWKQALRNREVRLAEMSSMGIGNKPCLDIRPSADQISDRSISVAQLSKTPRFRNSIAVSVSEDSGRCSRRPHSVISVSSSSSSGGSSAGPPTALHLGLDCSPRLHHRSTTLNSQCSVESGIIADISITSDDGVDSGDRNHWKSTLESPTSSHPPTTSTPLQSPTSSHAPVVPSTSSSTDVNLTPYDQEMSINL